MSRYITMTLESGATVGFHEDDAKTWKPLQDIATDFVWQNERIGGGVVAGDFIMVFARPETGKTLFFNGY